MMMIIIDDDHYDMYIIGREEDGGW